MPTYYRLTEISKATGLKGVAGEARKGNAEEQKGQAIPRVDATQLTHNPKS